MPEAQQTNFVQVKLARLRREAEEREAQRRARVQRLPYADLRRTPVSIEALKLIAEQDARAAGVAAIELKVRSVAVVAVDPSNAAVKKIIAGLEAQKYAVKIFVVSRSGIEQAWNFYRFVPPPTEEITGKVKIREQRMTELSARLKTFQAVQEEIKNFDFKTVTTSTVFETVLAGALANHASDIHFEKGEYEARVRYRIDGILHDITSEFPPHHYEMLISRIKLVAGMKINIHDEAQDGRFTIALAGKEVEVRVSVIPSEFGETVVMRLLDPEAINVDLGGLGLRDDDLALVERALKLPNGLILNTGPTGSGKTTTLYAFLKRIVSPEIKIITIEDPIEYRIEGIEQTQIDPSAGYTFGRGLRAIVRQDPDAILVGEIRDLETADIALQAALTGHLVFSTLHTNDAVGAVPRLVNLGIKAVSIGPALKLVIAQRLVRKLCETCRTAKVVDAELSEKIKKFLAHLPIRVNRAVYENPTIYDPVGCDACNRFGYRGRIGIFEFFDMGPEFEELVLKEASEVAMKKFARERQMVTMQEDGILKVIAGLTTFEEVEGATGQIVWE